MTSRRAKIEIIYDMLRAIHEKGGTIKPTHLLYKSNLSHKKMTLYVNNLVSNGMIKISLIGDNKMFAITEKGIKYLADYKKIKEFSDSFGL
ncbi:MAG: winged helix-turn-helix domain-containing protein [Nanoarchaeota archaeon]